MPLSKQGGITPHKQSLLCCVSNHRKPFRAQAPLAIPKLWRRYSRASYIPCPLRGKGLGKRGGAPFGKGDGGIRKKHYHYENKKLQQTRACHALLSRQ